MTKIQIMKVMKKPTTSHLPTEKLYQKKNQPSCCDICRSIHYSKFLVLPEVSFLKWHQAESSVSSADRRDYNEDNHSTHGLQFFKAWEHVGDRYDDLNKFARSARFINDIMMCLRDPSSTWHMQMVRTVFNYQGCVDLSSTPRTVIALARLKTNEKHMWVLLS